MNTVSKFVVLYLTPILSFTVAVWVYASTYGRSDTSFLAALLPLFMMAGFVLSSTVAYSLISHFFVGKRLYTGIFFAGLGWIFEAIVMIPYLMLFHGFLNP